MKVLVLGATGATGRLVVKQLIDNNIETKIIVRNIDKVDNEIRQNKLVECISGEISRINGNTNKILIEDCECVVSCLGHNITFKGIFCEPRKLVTNAIINICKAMENSSKDKLKIVLMSSSAIRNRKIKENYSVLDKTVLSLLGILLPPHKDNEKASEYLIENFQSADKRIEWVMVRPDTLFNETDVSQYEVHESPKQSPVFNAGKTSRINAGHFMKELLCNDELWQTWKFKMPVIYNRE